MTDNKKVYEVVLEKNVPMPKSRYWSKWAKITDDMDIGDSILLPDRKTSDLFCQHGFRRGLRFTVRQEEDGLRVWRIK